MSADTRFAHVNDIDLAYSESGSGEPIIFVHGAISDHRVWAPQIAYLSERYRCIALDQRYFGGSWPGGEDKFTLATHAKDLCQFLRVTVDRPVHVVATSYGSGVVLASAVSCPPLFKSLFLSEPFLPSLVADPAEKSVVGQAFRSLAPVANSLSDGNELLAAERFFDWTSHAGAFASLREEFKVVVYHNARTLALQLAAPPPDLAATHVAQLTLPITLSLGELANPFFKVLVSAAHRLLPHAQVQSISNAHHCSSFENPAEFNAALLRHIAAAA